MKRVIVAGAAVLAAAVLGGCTVNPNGHTYPGETAVGAGGYTVTAPFDNVQNLVPNSDVQYRDVTIGTVTKIAQQGWHAVVTLRLEKSVTLPANVTLKVAQKSLLGAEYVEIDDPSKPSGSLRAVKRLPMTQTGNYPETEQVLAAVSLLLNNGGLSQIDTITTQLNAALGGHESDAREIVGQLQTLLGTLNNQKNNVVSALDAMNSLAGTLAAQKSTIAAALDRVSAGVNALNEERDKLVTAIEAVGKFGTEAGDVIVTTRTALLGNLANLKPVLQQLQKAGNNLPNALKYAITIPFPALTVQNALKGQYANLFLTLDLTPQAITSGLLNIPTGTSSAVIENGNPITTPLNVHPTASSKPAAKSGATAKSGAAPPAAPTPSTSKSCNILLALLGAC